MVSGNHLECQLYRWEIRVLAWMSRWTLNWVPENHLVELLRKTWSRKLTIVTLVAPVQADDVLAGSVRGESEFAFTAVNLEQKHYSCFSSDEQQFTFERMLFLLTRIHLWEDDLVIRISDFHVHPNLRAGMYCKIGLSYVSLSYLDGANPFVLGS